MKLKLPRCISNGHAKFCTNKSTCDCSGTVTDMCSFQSVFLRQNSCFKILNMLWTHTGDDGDVATGLLYLTEGIFLFLNFTENGGPHFITIMIVHCQHYSNMMSVEVQNLSNWQCNFCSGVCYLDHVGATLYAESQIKAIAEDLCENVYGNPHSLSTSSRYSTDVIDQIRYRCVIILILNYVSLSSYLWACVLSGSIKFNMFQLSKYQIFLWFIKKHLRNTSVNNVQQTLNEISVHL
jgi:hypothetical protein